MLVQANPRGGRARRPLSASLGPNCRPCSSIRGALPVELLLQVFGHTLEHIGTEFDVLGIDSPSGDGIDVDSVPHDFAFEFPPFFG